MRSIIKYARTVQFNWVPGLAIEDMAADLVSLLNDGTIAQWGVDTDNRGYRIDVFMPDGMVFELRQGDSLRFESGQASPIERIGWRGAGVLRVDEAYRLIGRAYDLSRIEDLYELNRGHDVRLEKMRLVIDGHRVHEDYTTAVKIVGDEELRYDVGRPSMSELREKYLPIYNEITNN